MSSLVCVFLGWILGHRIAGSWCKHFLKFTRFLSSKVVLPLCHAPVTACSNIPHFLPSRLTNIRLQQSVIVSLFRCLKNIYLIYLVLILVSLITSEVKHLFILSVFTCLLTICNSYSENCLFISFAVFLLCCLFLTDLQEFQENSGHKLFLYMWQISSNLLSFKTIDVFGAYVLNVDEIFYLMFFAFLLRSSCIMIGLTAATPLSPSPFLPGTQPDLGLDKACEIFGRVFFWLLWKAILKDGWKFQLLCCVGFR